MHESLPASADAPSGDFAGRCPLSNNYKSRSYNFNKKTLQLQQLDWHQNGAALCSMSCMHAERRQYATALRRLLDIIVLMRACEHSCNV